MHLLYVLLDSLYTYKYKIQNPVQPLPHYSNSKNLSASFCKILNSTEEPGVIQSYKLCQYKRRRSIKLETKIEIIRCRLIGWFNNSR